MAVRHRRPECRRRQFRLSGQHPSLAADTSDYVEQMRQCHKNEPNEYCREEILDNIEQIGLGIASETIQHHGIGDALPLGDIFDDDDQYHMSVILMSEVSSENVCHITLMPPESAPQFFSMYMSDRAYLPLEPSVESEKSSKKTPKHRRTITMLFSTRDIDILQLLRWCKLIRCNDLIRVFSEDDISNLLTLSLIKIHRKSGSFVLTSSGHQLLDDAVSNLPPSQSLLHSRTQKLIASHMIGIYPFYRRSFLSDKSPYTGVASPKPPDTDRI